MVQSVRPVDRVQAGWLDGRSAVQAWRNHTLQIGERAALVARALCEQYLNGAHIQESGCLAAHLACNLIRSSGLLYRRWRARCQACRLTD